VLQQADIQARKDAEEADKRDRAAEIRRDERLKKVNYMKDMEDGIEVCNNANNMYIQNNCRSFLLHLQRGSIYLTTACLQSSACCWSLRTALPFGAGIHIYKDMVICHRRTRKSYNTLCLSASWQCMSVATLYQVTVMHTAARSLHSHIQACC
jgi:hypothetical protein